MKPNGLTLWLLGAVFTVAMASSVALGGMAVSRLDRMDARLDRIEDRVEAVDAKVQLVQREYSRIAVMEQRMGAMEKAMDIISGRVLYLLELTTAERRP